MIKKILVSQPRPTSEKSPYFDIADKMNVEIVFRPFIKVVGITPKEFRQQKISILDPTAVIFTSRHAIDNFFSLCNRSTGDLDHLVLCTLWRKIHIIPAQFDRLIRPDVVCFLL